MAGIALAALTLFSCDDTTDTIGGSLTDNVDKLEISTDTFQVETRSIHVPSQDISARCAIPKRELT